MSRQPIEQGIQQGRPQDPGEDRLDRNSRAGGNTIIRLAN